MHDVDVLGLQPNADDLTHAVEFKGFKWLIQTTDFHGVGSTIGIRLNPEDIHIMHKSEYSGMFGDYSSYSAEYDELAEDADEEEE